MVSDLIAKLECALESYWDDLANLGYVTDDSVYYWAQELEGLGLGGVLIHTMHGQLKWFDLAEMSF